MRSALLLFLVLSVFFDFLVASTLGLQNDESGNWITSEVPIQFVLNLRVACLTVLLRKISVVSILDRILLVQRNIKLTSLLIMAE
jgi:hypothetical protein